MDHQLAYWEECIANTAEDCGLTLTAEQIEALAYGVQGGHENYGMAFYSPPASDSYHRIDREWQAKYNALKAEFDAYRGNAETAVKRALRQYDDANVSIAENGEVYRHGGRTEQIQ